MKATFHILDALSRDQINTVTREDENEKEVEVHYESDSGASCASRGKPQDRIMVIHLFGMTAEGESLRCDVTGFRPYLYAKVPPSITEEQFKQQLRGPKSLTVKRVKRRELYGFTADEEFTFFKLSVNSLSDFRNLKKLLLNDYQEPMFKVSKNAAPLPIYESGLDPLLRFFHLQDLAPCGWVSVLPSSESEDETTEIRVITCDWADVEPVKVPPKPSAPFKTLFWDIECYSHSGEFPVAKGNGSVKGPGAKGDPVIQIGCVLKDSDGSIQKTIFVLDTCDPITGAVVNWYKTEREMLLAWFAWLAETNPDIWVGYNIFGFDERYVWERALMLGITEDESFQVLSRLYGHGGFVKLTEKRLSSSALGDNFLHTLSLQGRLQVDLYHVVKRGYQLPSYKLDEVAKYFISGKLKGLTRDDDGSWLIKTSGTGNARAGRSIVLLDEIGDELTEKLTILEATKDSIRVQASEADMELDTDLAVKWVVVKDDVSPADIFRLHRGSSKDRATVAAYCIQDCDLTMDLYDKLETFNNAMSMANVCSVPVTMIFTRGQGIKIESLIFKFCHTANLTIVTQISPPFNATGPRFDEDGNEIQESQDSYEGAIVLDPNPGFYTKSPIGVCDFASLYPSTIESENISYDSLLWVRDYDLKGKETGLNWSFGNIEKYQKMGEAMGCRWIDIAFDIWKPDPADTRKQPVKLKVGVRVCRYAQYPGTRKAALPNIVHNLLAARAAKRAEIKKESDPFRKALLDAEQLAYKLTANSLYGQLGSGVFKVRLQHLAASVTAYGRKQILFAKAAIERFYGPEAKDPRCSAQVIYGDTDSLFIEINPRNPDTGERLEGREAIQATIDITEEAGHFITKALKKPHDFEFDKAFYPFIIFSKKRYVGNMYEENADDYVQKSMGIATKRRDYAPIVKTIYGGAIKILLANKGANPVGDAAAFVKKWVNDLMDNKVSLSQLTLTRSLRSEYKSDLFKKAMINAELDIQRIQKALIQKGDNIIQDKATDFNKIASVDDRLELYKFLCDSIDDLLDRVTSSEKSMLSQHKEEMNSKRLESARTGDLAHKVLANRMCARDPGNAPASGDRLSFIYFKVPSDFRGVQGDRVETPAFMKANGLKPDPQYYIEHQLENPLGQLFSIMVDKLPGAKPPLKGWSLEPSTQLRERELYAQDYLFKAAKQKATNTLLGMWKIAPSTAPPVAQTIQVRGKAKEALAAIKATPQTRASSLFEDRMMADAISKDKKKSKKK